MNRTVYIASTVLCYFAFSRFIYILIYNYSSFKNYYIVFCVLNMPKYIYLISYGWTFVFSPVWSLNIHAHFSWYTLAHISIWYEAGVECGMVTHRVCISATLVDDVKLFPTVAVNYLHSHQHCVMVPFSSHYRCTFWKSFISTPYSLIP